MASCIRSLQSSHFQFSFDIRRCELDLWMTAFHFEPEAHGFRYAGGPARVGRGGRGDRLPACLIPGASETDTS